MTDRVRPFCFHYLQQNIDLILDQQSHKLLKGWFDVVIQLRTALGWEAIGGAQMRSDKLVAINSRQLPHHCQQ